MRPETFIASRLFSSGKDNISATVVRIAVLSIALGLAVMVISVAVVVGFKEQIRDKVIGFVAHIQIESLSNNLSWEVTPFTLDDSFIDKLMEINGIKHVQAVASKAGIIKTEDQIQGIVLKGIGVDYDWTYLSVYILEGKKPMISDTGRSEEVLISKKIAEKLDIKIGDPLRMWFVSGENQQTRGRRFLVTGIYETGLVEFDDMYIFGDIQHVQRLNNWQADQFDAVEISIFDVNNMKEIAEEIYFTIPVDLTASTANESYPHIFDWLDLQDMNVIILIILMILVSGITMISTLLIIILERTSMVGILKAMGADNRFIQRVFLINTLALFAKGMFWGNLISIGFCLLQLQYGFLKLPAESYYLSEVPIHFSWVHVLVINAGALAVWFLTLTIPTSVISKIQPSRAIRYS
jgi:lipoprotein-releasing system permease protein